MDHQTWSAEQAATTVTVDGHEATVAYFEQGAETDGPPVVFLHGIPTWSYMWRDVLDPVASNRHVVAMDMVGYGNSTIRDGIDRSIRAQEQALSGLLDAMDTDTVSLVAHDIGGAVALRFAAHEPDRVEQLVLSNAACYDSWPVSFINQLGVPATLDRDASEVRAELRSVFAEGVYGDAEDHQSFVEGMMAPWQSSEGLRSLVRNAVATNTNHTMEIEYEAITAETTLLWGADDILQPVSYAERMASDVAGEAAVVEIDDAYHWVVEDRPEEYATHLGRLFD